VSALDIAASEKAAEAKRNILLLAVAQALYSCCVITVFATAGLVGLTLAPSPGLATLPVTSFVIGAMLSTIPISMLMQRYGRPLLFKAGALISLTGATLALVAIFNKNFALFCFATAMIGVFQATAGFYRFAAAEASDASTKSIAISWVLTGGVVAAVVGTIVSSGMAEFFANAKFAGSYLAVIIFAALNFALIFMMRLPRPSAAETAGPQRSWAELLRQPRLIVAMAAAMIGYALMNLMMTAAPIAMIGCGFTHNDASWVIQWHVLAMFVPSFFTGQLIKNYGVERITFLGMLILIAAGIVGLLGLAFSQFTLALILLGLGWNFAFIGGTTMLTDCYRPSERGKVQAANDFGISALMAVASLSSGSLLANFGWQSIPYAIFPSATLALILIAWLMMSKPQEAA
jgi:predicted MFS family arabinose efflux permease